MFRLLKALAVVAMACSATAQEPCFESGAYMRQVANLLSEGSTSVVEVGQAWAFTLRDAPGGPVQLRTYSLHDPAAPVELMHQTWVGSIRAVIAVIAGGRVATKVTLVK